MLFDFLWRYVVFKESMVEKLFLTYIVDHSIAKLIIIENII